MIPKITLLTLSAPIARTVSNQVVNWTGSRYKRYIQQYFEEIPLMIILRDELEYQSDQRDLIKKSENIESDKLADIKLLERRSKYW